MTASAAGVRTVRGWAAGPLPADGHLDPHPLVDPHTGEPAGWCAVAGPAVVERVIAGAAAAQPVWEDTPPRERAAALLRLADAVEQRADDLARLDSAESGRALRELVGGDVPSAVETLRWFAGLADKVPAAVLSAGPDHLAHEVVRAAGVGVAVLPWNFPLAMAAWKVGPALATGNALVLKPAEQTPSSAVLLAELAAQAGIPDGVLSVVTGDGRTGAALTGHPAVGAVSFTGSEEVGRTVLASVAARSLASVSLEMGGKSAHLVLADAPRGDRLLDGLVEAAFSAGGQNCTAGSRVLVHRSRAAEVVDGLVARAEQLVVGDPSDPATDVGPLVTAQALDRVTGLLERAVVAGAVLRTGGTAPAGSRGFHLRPAVLTDVAPDAEIEHTEVFGPVVTVSVFDDLEEAVRRATATRYGLHAAVWTTDLATAHTLARRLRAGTVSVNCYSEGDIATPFGGLGASGFGGREKGFAALEQWITRTSVWTDLT